MNDAVWYWRVGLCVFWLLVGCVAFGMWYMAGAAFCLGLNHRVEDKLKALENSVTWPWYLGVLASERLNGKL